MPRPIKPREPGQRIAYKITEVARMLGCDRKTVYRWLKKGILREVAIPGGKRLVDARSVEKLIEGKAKFRDAGSTPGAIASTIRSCYEQD